MTLAIIKPLSRLGYMEERNKEMFSPLSDTKSESAESKHEHSFMFFMK